MLFAVVVAYYTQYAVRRRTSERKMIRVIDDVKNLRKRTLVIGIFLARRGNAPRGCKR